MDPEKATHNSALAAALAGDAVRKRLSNMGYAAYPADPLTPEAFGALQKSDMAKWMPIVKDAGLYQDRELVSWAGDG